MCCYILCLINIWEYDLDVYGDKSKTTTSRQILYLFYDQHLTQKHLCDSNARKWDDIEVLHEEPNNFKRSFSEMVFIKWKV